VPAVTPIKYDLGYRSRTRTLNPNPKTDPNPNANPKSNRKENDTGVKFNIVLYIKVIAVGQGWGYKRPITGSGSQTHMDGPDF